MATIQPISAPTVWFSKTANRPKLTGKEGEWSLELALDTVSIVDTVFGGSPLSVHSICKMRSLSICAAVTSVPFERRVNLSAFEPLR